MGDALDRLVAIGLLEDADIALDSAAMELAAADRVHRDLTVARGQMDDMAARLAARAKNSMAGRRAAAIAGLLAGTEGFNGDNNSYDAPQNADFLAMLDRRMGLPISLSILYVALARRLGWEAAILGVPGHVLVAIGGSGSRVVIDPFNNGNVVEKAGIAALVQRALGPQVALTPDHVQPLSNRAALVRLVSNPASRALRAGDEARALTLYRRMTLIAPDISSLWWERSRLERRAGDISAARRSLAAMAETTHDPALMERIRAAQEALAR